MKKLLFLGGILALLYACDVIEGPKREGTVGKDCEAKCDFSFTFSPADEVQRVLLEDYTGFQCGNCPYAGEELKTLEPQYGDTLIVMKVHAGVLAEPVPDHPTDYRTSIGNRLDLDFGMSAAGVPRGMINRKEFGGTKGLLYNQWNANIQAVANQQPAVAIKATTHFDANARNLSVCLAVKALQSIEAGRARIVVYLVENDIVGYQKWYFHTPVDNYDYVHHATLRGSIGGAYGFTLNENAMSVGQILSDTYCINLNAEWVAQNMDAIVAVIDNNTQEILNSYKVAIN